MRTLLLGWCLCLLPGVVSAQTAAQCTGPDTTGGTVQVSMAARVQMTKSADHDAVVAGTTTPVLSAYIVMVCTGTTMTTSANVGKPTPDASGLVTFPVPNMNLLAKNTPYYVRVYATGPGGTSPTPSGASFPFVVGGPPAAPAGRPAVLP